MSTWREVGTFRLLLCVQRSRRVKAAQAARALTGSSDRLLVLLLPRMAPLARRASRSRRGSQATVSPTAVGPRAGRPSGHEVGLRGLSQATLSPQGHLSSGSGARRGIAPHGQRSDFTSSRLTSWQLTITHRRDRLRVFSAACVADSLTNTAPPRASRPDSHPPRHPLVARAAPRSVVRAALRRVPPASRGHRRAVARCGDASRASGPPSGPVAVAGMEVSAAPASPDASHSAGEYTGRMVRCPRSYACGEY